MAQATLRRTEALARQDFATQATLDQNKSALEQANAGIARTNALIAEKLVTAPFDGKLGVRQIDLGEYLKAGTAVVTLTNLDTLYANFTLPEQERGQVEVGQDVEVRVDAYPDRVFTGKVTTIEPQVDPQTRTLKIQATLANPDQLLFPGHVRRHPRYLAAARRLDHRARNRGLQHRLWRIGLRVAERQSGQGRQAGVQGGADLREDRAAP